MVCPFCGKEMNKGILSGDGRCTVRWKTGDKKAGFMDTLSDSGRITAAKHTLSAFTIESYYCPSCKKMIFDTDITA
ncbi:MAG: PF20097 family protein [Lachnospiraceae bacterium]